MKTQTATFMDSYFGIVRVTISKDKGMSKELESKRANLRIEEKKIKANRG